MSLPEPGARSCPGEERETTTNPPFWQLLCFLLQSLSTDCRCGVFSGSFLLIINSWNIKYKIMSTILTAINAIFMYRLRWVLVPWSSYETTLAGEKVRLHGVDYLHSAYGNLYEQIAYGYITNYLLPSLLLQPVHPVSHTKKRSLVPPSTFLCELILQSQEEEEANSRCRLTSYR